MQRIQIARGIAALLVVLYHANLYDPAAIEGFFLIGFVGVDFFFVLSGFIIAYMHANDIGHPSRVGLYVLKRVRRIVPIYWVYLLIAILLNFIILLLFDRTIIYWSPVDAYSIALSAVFWPTDLAGGHWPILPTAWTLSHEIVFYMLFAVVIIFGRRAGSIAALFWATGILLSSTGTFGETTPAISTLIDSRNLEFLAGAAVGLYLRPGPLRRNVQLLVGSLSILLLSASWYHAWLGYPFAPRIDVVNFGIPFLLIILSIASSDLSSPRTPSPPFRIFSYFGDASYSIYLVHALPMFMCAILAKHLGVVGSPLFVLLVAVGVSSGVAAYELVERPLLRALRNKSSRAPTTNAE